MDLWRRRSRRPQGVRQGSRLIFRFLVNFCWFFFKWGLALAVLAALGGGVYFYTQMDREIRHRVQQVLSQHYRGLNVRVQSAHFVEGYGIEIRGLSIADPRAPRGAPRMLEVDEVVIVCNPSIAQLVQNKLNVKQIIVRRPRLYATCGADRTWDVSQLLPLPKFGNGTPPIELKSGSLQITEFHPSRTTTCRLQDLNLLVQARAQASSGTSVAAPRWLDVQGEMRANYSQRITLQGQIQPESRTWSFSGEVDELELCPELLASLPSAFPTSLKELQHVRAHGKLFYEISNDRARTPATRFAIVGDFARGRVDDPRLPYPLTDLSARLRCSNDQIEIEQFTASSGQMKLELSAKQFGFAPNSRKTIVARAERVQLEPEMMNGLPEAVRREWNKYLPAGEVAVNLHLEYDGQRWRPDLVVQLANVSFTFHKFPYPLHHTTGRIAYQGGQLNLDLTTRGGDQPIRIHGEWTNPGPQGTGWLEISGTDITVDERLVSALPDRGRTVVQSLNPNGRFEFSWRSWRDDPRQPRLRSRLALKVVDGSIRYDRFPYPVAGVQGTVEMLDGHWKFREFKGVNDTGFVTCEGTMLPTPQGSQLELFFAGTDVPLEKELHDALPAHAAQLWSDLRPRGSIDLTGEVRYFSGDSRLSVSLRVEPFGDTTSIEPVPFPYRLEKIRGTITYRDGRLEMHDLHALHGETSLSAQGTCESRPNGSWYIQFSDLNVDRLKLDRDLLLALPSGLRRVATQLDPTGPINLRGALGLAGGQPDGLLRSRWDLTFNMHQGTLDCGVKLTNLHGEVQLVGDFDGQRVQSRGELLLDSLTYKNIQLTEVRGPIWIDDQRVLLGVWATAEQKQPQRRITAKVYGGTLVGDGWVHLVEVPRFALQASLADADVERFSRESMEGKQKLKGKVLANLTLQGTGRGLHSLTGVGDVQLSEGELYELPVVVPLLKVLRVRAPDTTAFTRSDMNFRIEGQHVYFDQLDLLGDAVSLYGKGELGFDRELKMTFHSVLGRNDLPVPLLRNIVGEASQQIMQIHVRGSVDNPTITNQPLPGLNNALQQLGADLQPKR